MVQLTLFLPPALKRQEQQTLLYQEAWPGYAGAIHLTHQDTCKLIIDDGAYHQETLPFTPEDVLTAHRVLGVRDSAFHDHFTLIAALECVEYHVKISRNRCRITTGRYSSDRVFHLNELQGHDLVDMPKTNQEAWETCVQILVAITQAL